MSVKVQNLKEWNLCERELISAALRALESEGHANATLGLILTDDEQLHELNLTYRGYDKPTDVLSFCNDSDSFDLADPDNDIGDIFISIETAERQAVQHQQSLQEEVQLLVVHGVLHLLGYDDVTDEDAAAMQDKEIELGVRKPQE